MPKVLGLICVLVVCDVMAKSLEELQQDYMNIVVECMEQHPLSPSDIEAMQTKNSFNNQAVNCLFACAFRKTGMMDDKGNLSVEGVRKISEKYLSDNSDMMKKSDAFTDACKNVNDVPVTDGEKGCERAALIYKCSQEKASDFDFV